MAGGCRGYLVESLFATVSDRSALQQERTEREVLPVVLIVFLVVTALRMVELRIVSVCGCTLAAARSAERILPDGWIDVGHLLAHSFGSSLSNKCTTERNMETYGGAKIAWLGIGVSVRMKPGEEGKLRGSEAVGHSVNP